MVMIPEEVERAINRFESAVTRAWTMDTEDSFNDKNRKTTKEAHDLVIQRRDELREAITKCTS
jgi:hypothetical protein